MKKQTLLFSCLYGSRLYGTQTPTSDLDLKHVVLPSLDDMLLGKQLANKGNVAKLLSVKRGEVPLETVKAELDQKLEMLKTLEQTTDLRPTSHELTEEFKGWLAKWMRKFYSV